MLCDKYQQTSFGILQLHCQVTSIISSSTSLKMIPCREKKLGIFLEAADRLRSGSAPRLRARPLRYPVVAVGWKMEDGENPKWVGFCANSWSGPCCADIGRLFRSWSLIWYLSTLVKRVSEDIGPQLDFCCTLKLGAADATYQAPMLSFWTLDTCGHQKCFIFLCR